MGQATPLNEVTLESGAVMTDVAGWQIPDHFGDPAAEYHAARSGCALFDISPRGKVEVSGADAPSFLHNFCTNDVANMPLGAGCEAFFCNTRAKVLAHANIYHLMLGGGRHAFWLDVAPGQAEPLIKHLDRFVISEQVEFADRTSGFAQVHLAGPHAAAVLMRALADDIPDLEPLQHMERTFGATVHSHIRRHDPLGVIGFDIVCLATLAPGLWRMLAISGAKPAGRQAYEWLRVQAGTPEYGIDITEDRFAFEIGRTNQAISYAKGCYLGQEPIVMARDRAGHAPRTLMGLLLDSPDPVAAGSKLVHGTDDAGYTTSSVRPPGSPGAIAMAYLRHGFDSPGTRIEVVTPTARIGATVKRFGE
jgi:folate-binding protein YgfZ